MDALLHLLLVLIIIQPNSLCLLSFSIALPSASTPWTQPHLEEIAPYNTCKSQIAMTPMCALHPTASSRDSKHSPYLTHDAPYRCCWWVRCTTHHFVCIVTVKAALAPFWRIHAQRSTNMNYLGSRALSCEGIHISVLLNSADTPSAYPSDCFPTSTIPWQFSSQVCYAPQHMRAKFCCKTIVDS